MKSCFFFFLNEIKSKRLMDVSKFELDQSEMRVDQTLSNHNCSLIAGGNTVKQQHFFKVQ